MISVNFTFYNRFNLDFDTIDRPEGSGDYLFLHLISPMKITLSNKTIITKENAFILFDKGTPQLYSAVKTFQNSFIHFDCASSFISKYKIPLNTIFYLPNIEPVASLLRNIHFEFFLKKPYFETQLDSYMSQLFVTLARALDNGTSVDEKESYLFNVFQNARYEILSSINDEWTAESMAALTNLGTSQFYRYYRAFFGCSPKADLIDARIARAKELLISEQITVSEAAVKSGFQNYAHFSRYFKKKCNMSPQEWSRAASTPISSS